MVKINKASQSELSHSKSDFYSGGTSVAKPGFFFLGQSFILCPCHTFHLAKKLGLKMGHVISNLAVWENKIIAGCNGLFYGSP